MIIAIVGAGDLGGASASTLAARDRVGEIRLDRRGGRPRPRARRSTSSSRRRCSAATTRVTGGCAARRRRRGGRGCRGRRRSARRRASGRARPGSRCCAGWRLVPAARRSCWPAPRTPGSSSAALPSSDCPGPALSGRRPPRSPRRCARLIGLETAASPLDVHLDITGLPPEQIVVGWESGTIARRAVDGARSTPPARARIAARLPLLWPPGPIALAAAAADIVEAIALASQRPQAGLRGAGPRRCARAPRRHGHRAYVAPAGVARACSCQSLSNQERLALDHALR